MTTYELMPGDVVLAHSGDELRTLLGSCIGLVLTDPMRTMACMCHVVHTSKPPAQQSHNLAYGSVALQRMQGLLLSRGMTMRHCQAFAYGGGNMFPAVHSEANVSQLNVQWLEHVLHQLGISPVHSSLGGRCYRKFSWVVGPQEPRVQAIQMEAA